MKGRNPAILLLAGTFALPALADDNDREMRNLAIKSGCFICHAVDAGAKGPEGLNPVGPPWTAVAARYKYDKDAQKNLTDAVMGGTSPYNRHWKDQASGIAMPPNGVAISETDAKRLVAWILGLAK